MNKRQSKRAKSAAFNEAKRQNLWGEGRGQLLAKWWRKLLYKLSPKYRGKVEGIIGQWGKATIKRWSRNVYAGTKTPEYRKRMARRSEAIAQARKAEEARKQSKVDSWQKKHRREIAEKMQKTLESDIAEKRETDENYRPSPAERMTEEVIQIMKT